ncbi:dipeptide-binding protein DppE precursor [Variibacter gotjawalensis]|uniref:Dipeptide-binding protein DppE n=1 Tax=Variibacter gotjawalensis TaxID=1333996 RepID=A0A0S3PZF1_9BRAD|nr:ABC transporter substrate-binding protein [Variibacter gotjawalensis]NIK47138.1 peptide/nickel transport system substrate-binding protein [Variibacter gotjawalensis]RZS49038.1 peptide/nickel transport system substrate-binding protein [Variibacter gotjawalensis]BAT61300.1 dipeptide-binding protein DppE precursor [Variibacter gotjawalensis]
MHWSKRIALATLIAALPHQAPAQTLRAAMSSDIKILDPIWVSAAITRVHAYMIYDTLFALDAKGEVKPQMVDRYDVSSDNLTYTFTLREGLLWHDGKPVTAEDCIASIKRWSARDALGQKLTSFIESMTASSERVFEIKLKTPTGLLLFGLAKPAGIVPYMMPKRVAETDALTQITDYTGSGPFVFKKDEWKPGNKVVYVKFDKYKPRPEPISYFAGGKVAKVSRVEWVVIADTQQAVNSLLQGEVDLMEVVPHDLQVLLKDNSDTRIVPRAAAAIQYVFRPNHLTKPFDNAKIRLAAAYALNQKDFLDAAVGEPEFYKQCKSIYPCDTALATQKGMTDLLESNFEKSRALLKEANYNGAPVVLLHSTDLSSLTNLAPVAKALLEKGGFKVDMQSMDWQTLLSRTTKKDPADAGGWSAYMTSFPIADVINPATLLPLAANCEKAFAGWPCDEGIEALRDGYIRETDPAKQRAIAEALQVRERDVVTHLPIGQYYNVSGFSKKITGFSDAASFAFWGLEKR